MPQLTLAADNMLKYLFLGVKTSIPGQAAP